MFGRRDPLAAPKGGTLSGGRSGNGAPSAADETIILQPGTVSRSGGEAPATAPPVTPARSAHGRRLVDLAADWITFVAALRGGVEIAEPARVRERAEALRESFQNQAKVAGFADEDIDAAQFFLTAFLDETIRRSKGKGREEWIPRPLQLEWFQTNNAGVEFYEKLEVLRKERSRRIEAIEVAACCLALGFEGRLALAGEKRIERRMALLNELMLDVVIVRDRAAAAGVPELPRWITAAAFVVIALLLWLVISQLSHLSALRAADEINRTLTR
jgi:type VI secretion system protein ImpK